MLLGVAHRLAILNALPREGDLLTIRLLHDLKMKLAFGAEESELLDFKVNPGGGVQWKDQPEREFEIGKKEADIIRKGIAELDRGHKLTEDYLPLVELFGYEGEDK